MFGGIVETVGKVKTENTEQGCKKFCIEPQLFLDDLKIGDSVSVNGVCLTATSFDNKSFACTAVPETLALTNLSQLRSGSLVNLERALKVNDRIGGHYVQGHVDGVAEIVQIEAQGAASLFRFKMPKALGKYLVRKGYIAVDGMSLTLVEVGHDFFTVTLIPHTQAVTVAKHYTVGTQVNIEVDILGKYAEKLLEVSNDNLS